MAESLKGPDSPAMTDEKHASSYDGRIVDGGESEADGEHLDDPAAKRKLLMKLDLHVLPIFAVLWFLTFIDRVNIANAKVQGMEKTLGMKGNDFNVALVVFFATFIAFEVPFNMALGAKLKWLTPSYFLGSQCLILALFTIGQGLVETKDALVAMRIFVGLFEAGIVPGSVLIMSNYYPRYDLQWRMSLLAVANALASAFGGLIAYGIIDMDGDLGRKSWRWVFIIEGSVTAVFSILGMFLIVDWPEKQSFLTTEETRLMKHLIAKDCNKSARMDILNKDAIFRCVTDWKIWINVFIYIGTVCVTYSINLFGPTIIGGLNPKFTSRDILIRTAPVFLVSAVFCLASAWISDRMKHRSGVVISGYLISIVGFGILLTGKGVVPQGVRYMAIYFVSVGTFISLPVLWSLMANNVSGVYKVAFASSMQIGLGSVGGIVASFAYQTTDAPLYHNGHYVILSLMLMALVCVLVFDVGLFFEMKARKDGKRDHRLSSAEIDNMGDDHPHFMFTY